MQSPWPGSRLIPAARALAEGSLIAVAYAALQAAGGNLPFIGPLEFGLLVMLGTAWARRGRWLSPAADSLGLVALVVVAGAFGWLTDPQVRVALVDGLPLHALGLHVAGWVAAGVAFGRGAMHRVREDDSLIDERMLRWAVPALAIPWLLGYAVASGEVESRFAAAAYIGTIVFVGAGLTTIGLARLEALRHSTVGYWSNDRSWLLMVFGIAAGLTLISIPLAALLGIPSQGLLHALAVSLQTLILLVVLITAPAFLLAAWLNDLVPHLLANIPFQNQQLRIRVGGTGPGSDLAEIVLTVLVAGIFLYGFAAAVAILWIMFRDRTRQQDLIDPAFEERAVVVPERDEEPIARLEPVPVRAPPDPSDPTGAYLAALNALAEDGRWPRHAEETPAAHVIRADAEGMRSPAFHRLASVYQLARYGVRPISDRETRRARTRFDAFRAWLRHRQHS